MFLFPNRLMGVVFGSPVVTPAVNFLLSNLVWQIQGGGVRVNPTYQGTWRPVQSKRNENQYYLPGRNLPERYATVEEIRGLQASVHLRELHSWPRHVLEGDFDDQSFSRFYFAGMGQSYVQALDVVNDGKVHHAASKYSALPSAAGKPAYVVAFDFLSGPEYPVKKGAGAYGGDVFFDAEGKVLFITYAGERYLPGEARWARVKRYCRGTMLMWLTLVDHLLCVHLQYSNALATAVPTLPVTNGHAHPIRCLLWGHIFNANGVNRKAAATLTKAKGLFARGWALKPKAIKNIYNLCNGLPLFQWMDIPSRLALQGVKPEMKLPLHEDGLAFYKVVESYVGDYVRAHYADDRAVKEDHELLTFWEVLGAAHLFKELPPLTSRDILVDVLAAHIWYVTGYHTHVGSVHHDAVRSGVCPSSWYENDDDGDGAAGLPNADLWKDVTFTKTANLRLPITGDPLSTEQKSGFRDKVDYQRPIPPDAAYQPDVAAVGYPHLFHTAEQKGIHMKFIEDLISLQEEIISRNKMRVCGKGGRVPAVSRPYNCFDVNYVELSVGI